MRADDDLHLGYGAVEPGECGVRESDGRFEAGSRGGAGRAPALWLSDRDTSDRSRRRLNDNCQPTTVSGQLPEKKRPAFLPAVFLTARYKLATCGRTAAALGHRSNVVRKRL